MNKTIYPARLKKGSHIRVIAPARSASIISEDVRDEAVARLSKEGFKVSYGKNIFECNELDSSSVESRLEDIKAAFEDKKVDAVLTAIGGFNSIDLLDKIDYRIFKKNPKILCGFSDITVLSNAIYKKTGLVCYCGPHFSSWGMKKGFKSSLEWARACLSQERPFRLEPSQKWSDDPWYEDQVRRIFHSNKGPAIINTGLARGTLIGGNLSSFAALFGTQYMPSLKNSIVLIEDDETVNLAIFDRLLQSLILQKDFEYVKGIMIGRFQKNSKIGVPELRNIISSKPQLQTLPIIAEIDLGHTTPLATLPIGGEVEFSGGRTTTVKVIKH